MTIALGIVLALAQAVSSPPPATPQVKGTTPTACVAEVREFTTTRRAAARAALPAILTPEDSRGLVTVNQQISKDAAGMAATCAAKFDVATVTEAELPALAELYRQAGMPDAASTAVLRAIGASALGETERAAALMQAIAIGLTQPKSDARNATLESHVDALDRLSDAVLDVKYNAHSQMNGYYRADDIDAGIVKHSTWLIDTTKSASPELKQKYGRTAISAYENMAEAWAGQGRTDEAIALLRRAPADLGLAGVAASLESTLARYLLVGTPAAAITASRWLNGPDGSTVVGMKGHVTLLEFTAHWCGPCKESYPGIKRLLATYGAKGFRVVFATELYGYFGLERPLTPDVEFERDREYFKKEGLAVPIAVSDRVTPKTVDGRPVNAPDPNNAAYKVGAIPQIHLIDRQGRIRLIMVGFDDANEPQLAKLIEGLLAEK